MHISGVRAPVFCRYIGDQNYFQGNRKQKIYTLFVSNKMRSNLLKYLSLARHQYYEGKTFPTRMNFVYPVNTANISRSPVDTPNKLTWTVNIKL